MHLTQLKGQDARLQWKHESCRAELRIDLRDWAAWFRCTPQFWSEACDWLTGQWWAEAGFTDIGLAFQTPVRCSPVREHKHLSSAQQEPPALHLWGHQQVWILMRAAAVFSVSHLSETWAAELDRSPLTVFHWYQWKSAADLHADASECFLLSFCSHTEQMINYQEVQAGVETDLSAPSPEASGLLGFRTEISYIELWGELFAEISMCRDEAKLRLKLWFPPASTQKP